MLIQLIFALSFNLSGSTRDYSDLSLLCSVSQKTIHSLPEKYRAPEYLKLYSFFSLSPAKGQSGIIMQLFKQFKLPKDVRLHILKYVRPSLFLVSLKRVEKRTNIDSIKHDDKKNCLPPDIESFEINLSSLALNAFSPDHIDQRVNEHPSLTFKAARWIVIDDVDHLKEAGLVSKKTNVHLEKQIKTDNNTVIIPFNDNFYETHRILRSFNNSCYHPHAVNRRSDIILKKLNFLYGDSYKQVSDTKKNVVTIRDKQANNVEIDRFDFDDYVRNCFCWDEFLFVELIDEKIKITLPYFVPTHAYESSEPTNHRIEIYNIKIKEKVLAISLPLVKPYEFNQLSYSLSYVDSSNIYLYDHINRSYISWPYKNFRLIELMNQSD